MLAIAGLYMYNNHIITVYTEVEDIANVVLILSAHKMRRQWSLISICVTTRSRLCNHNEHTL